jgi:hypothetical protein
MEAYTATLESIGDSIIKWADPEDNFGGFTKVRMREDVFDDDRLVDFGKILNLRTKHLAFFYL